MLLVVGNLVYDWIAGPVEQLNWDQTVWPPHFAAGLGGNGGTTSFAAAREGARVRLVSAVGDDTHGVICRQTLITAGVDFCPVPVPNGPTAITMGLFRPDGARALVHRPGVLTHAFEGTPTLRPYGQGVRWLHIANPFAVPALRRQAARYLREAKEDGWQTSMDLGWDRLGEWRKVVDPCLEHCDWLFANAAEAEALGPVGVSTVVKRGAAGCEVEGERIEAERVEAIDTTGAGDCFCGAFLAALLAGKGAKEAATRANACAARSVTKAGPTSW